MYSECNFGIDKIIERLLKIFSLNLLCCRWMTAPTAGNLASKYYHNLIPAKVALKVRTVFKWSPGATF